MTLDNTDSIFIEVLLYVFALFGYFLVVDFFNHLLLLLFAVISVGVYFHDNELIIGLAIERVVVTVISNALSVLFLMTNSLTLGALPSALFWFRLITSSAFFLSIMWTLFSFDVIIENDFEFDPVPVFSVLLSPFHGKLSLKFFFILLPIISIFTRLNFLIKFFLKIVGKSFGVVSLVLLSDLSGSLHVVPFLPFLILLF